MSELIEARLPTADEQALKKEYLALLLEDRARLLLEQPFIAGLALHLELIPVVDSRLPTAATDGERVYFNPLFLKQLSSDNRLFVLAHEVWHCVAGHFTRQQGRDPHLWNLAIDHEVNSLLEETGMKRPANAVFFSEYLKQRHHPNPSAEQVYAWLLTKPKSKQNQQKSFDVHQPNLEEQPEQILDPDYSPGKPDATTQRVWKERVVCAAQQARQAGNLNENISQWINASIHPTLPWQQLLRQFVQRVYGGQRCWTRPSRRHIHRGLYLPGMQAASLNINVALDTSGSTQEDLPLFVSELKSLLQSFDRVQLKLIHCSTEIARTEEFTEVDLDRLDRFEACGSGGTDLRPPFNAAIQKTQPDCLVYLTDGYGPAPSQPPGFPVLWVLTADGRKPSDWGDAAYLPQRHQQQRR